MDGTDVNAYCRDMSAIDNFAANLSRLMKDGGMSAQALERATDAIGKKVGKSTIDRATRAETPISVPAVDAIATVFKVEPWQMLRAPMDTTSPVAIDIYDSLRHLSEALMRVDSLDRGMASHLLSELATNPGGVGTVAVKLARLLGDKAAPLASSTRVDSWSEKAKNLEEARPMGPTFSNFTAMKDEHPSQDQAESGDEK